MPYKILVYRGIESNLPTLDEGELALTTDTKKIFVGTIIGNFWVNDPLSSLPVGTPFPVWEESSGSFVDSNKTRLVKLSKDLVSTNLYNEGKLGNQSLSLSNETVFYTAQIINPASPIFSKIITLINSTENTTNSTTNEPTFLGASDSNLQNLVNSIQSHSLQIKTGNPGTGTYTSYTRSDNNDLGQLGITSPLATTLIANGFGTPRTGKTTRPDTTTATYYMRII